jgi:starch synthase
MTADCPTNSMQTIWMVTREYDGLAGAGGVKDVCRQLAEALTRASKQVTVVLPLYGFMDPLHWHFSLVDLSLDVDMNYVGDERREEIRVWTRHLNGVRIFLVEAERYSNKDGVYTYTAEEEKRNPLNRQGTTYFDYFAMNILLQKATLALIIVLGETVDIIHCHDGHTAVLPAMLREGQGFRYYFRNTGSVVTIHNAGLGYHQEVGDLPFAKEVCGLPYRVILDNLLDGKFDPFLAASSYAVLNTVSENYARELQETNDDALTGWLGHRLLVRGVRLEGITNGINPDDFAPDLEKSVKEPNAKQTGKLALLQSIQEHQIADVQQFGNLMPDPQLPLFTMIGRLITQKGVDILLAALRMLLVEDTHFLVLIQGIGDREIEEDLARLAEDSAYMGRICFLRGYDEDLARKIYVAGDFFLIPSRYEPCGLTDFIAQLAGNLPIVHHVGGLVKVVDGTTGFAFHDHAPEALVAAMLRALQTFRERPAKILKMQKTAVAYIHKYYTWDKIVHHYLRLYRIADDLRDDSVRESQQARGGADVRAEN